jgi:hypothetical protein
LLRAPGVRASERERAGGERVTAFRQYGCVARVSVGWGRRRVMLGGHGVCRHAWRRVPAMFHTCRIGSDGPEQYQRQRECKSDETARSHGARVGGAE